MRQPGRPTWRIARRSLAVLGVLAVTAGVVAAPAGAASVTGASFTAGGVVRDGVFYAKTGAALTLTVTTDNTTQCLEITGAHTSTQKSSVNNTSWSVPLTANSGNGVQTVTVIAYKKSHQHQERCLADGGETFGTFSASYTLDNDNTGPVVTAELAPAPNAAGWNRDDVTITWSATDDSGVKSLVPATDSVTANTPVAGVSKTTLATDNVGNTTTGSVLVKLDKDAPVVTASRTPAANAHGWNNTDVTASFTTEDALSGVAASAAGMVFGEGTDQSVTGTGTDVAGNSASATVSGVNIDTTDPTLSGVPTTQPNGSGWYRGDVVVAWTAADALSGLAAAAPGNSTITAEGESLTATETVTDKAGNSKTASSPAVKIDRTAPTTNATAPTGWNSTDQTVTLSATDGGSGVATTHYKVGDGAEQTGSSVVFDTDGEHTLQYWSVDRAGNAEAPKTVTVKVDKTAPSISSSQSPLANDFGWNNSDVTVSFECGDIGGSGIASCSPGKVVAEDGEAQEVSGTATDNAGNTATAFHAVNLDKTPPVVTGSRTPAANTHGWNNTDVTASFLTTDALSGVATPAAGKTFGQGADQSVRGTGTDFAGNNGSATVGGVNVDKTNPELSGTPSTTGWSRGDVTVTWTAGDELSGLDGDVPAPSVVTGEGDNLSAGASVSDKAGNTTAATVSDIRIDRTAPSTSISVGEEPVASGWYDKDVTVTLTATDPLSGVETTFYKVGDGGTQEYTVPFTHEVTGVSTITYWSVDVAGNTEGEKGLELKLDGTAPTTEIDLPAAYDAGGWYADSVPVAFTVTDTESGVAKTFYQVDDGQVQEWTGTFTHTLDGTHTISFWSVDAVGNVETAKNHELKVDTSDPTITGSRTPAANGFGWNNESVTVSFVCEDSQSGVEVANCTPAVTLENEGAGQQVSGTATDNVGKTASTTVGDINIDKSAPSLAGTPTTEANAAGWYKGDVTVAWESEDGLSGVVANPGNSTITGEGSNLSTGAEVSDEAGNETSASVTGIKIDRKAPVVTGKVVDETGGDRSPVNGWYNSSVRTRYTATDPTLADGTAGSGVADQPDDVVLTEDGPNQVATATATDRADNSGSGSVGGISIDSKAPTSTIDIECEGANGWCKSKATVTVSAADQAGLSGVKELRVSVNRGPWKTTAGASTDVDVPLAAKSGLATVEFLAVDNAGNVETKNSASLMYDSIAPTVSLAKDPAANSDGWNNSDVTVKVTAVDDEDGSGVDPATITPDVAVSTETAGQTVTAKASDLAGNTGTNSISVKLDRTAPVITGAVTTQPNASGWYAGPVTIKWTCNDALSGIATCPTDEVVTTNGADQNFTGTAVDRAGNTATARVSGINIDSSGPKVEITGVTSGALYQLGDVPGAGCTATDEVSGLASACTGALTGGTANGVGSYTYTASATDRAGNTSTATATYRVVYSWNGFLQPINDTAHQIDQGVSVFKGGSTVPVKFQLKTAEGVAVSGGTATWTTPSAGGPAAASITEEAYALAATSGGTYRYDATDKQYIYNWSTKGMKTGLFYRIGVKLDDGQTYTVSIGLR